MDIPLNMTGAVQSLMSCDIYNKVTLPFIVILFALFLILLIILIASGSFGAKNSKALAWTITCISVSLFFIGVIMYFVLQHFVGVSCFVIS
jgi:hypothetical protein